MIMMSTEIWGKMFLSICFPIKTTVTTSFVFNISLNFSAFTVKFYSNSQVHTFTGEGQKGILFCTFGPIIHK